jgi:hypothetical protein
MKEVENSAGFKKTFESSLRNYVHPACKPIEIIYGRRYSLNGT